MENQEPQYEEIDLREYIKVLWNRKWSIVIIFSIAAVFAAVISLITPPTFEASSLVEIGKIKGENIQSVNEIKSVFEKEAVLKKLRNNLKDPLNLTKDIKTNTIKSMFSIKEVENGEEGAHYIQISGKAKTPKNSVIVTNEVVNNLLSYHDTKFATAKTTFESEMESIKQNKEKVKTDLNQDIKTLEKEKEKTSQDILQVEQELTQIENDINFYNNEIQKRANITSEGQGRMVESYIALLDKNKQRQEDQKNKKRSLEQNLVKIDARINEKQSSLANKMADFEEKIQQKEFERQYSTTQTKVEVIASAPETRIAPNRKLNVLIAGVLGAFIGILYAFGAEYFSKDKDKDIKESEFQGNL